MNQPLAPVAEVISIGDEMTSGARLDTNSQWLSNRLGDLGVRVLYHTTVGDSLAACEQVFRSAAQRASVIIATGGLGPTADDLTREAIAAAANVELEFREPAMRHIESLFALRNREMPERNRTQAMFPIGSDMIANPQGTAPGIDMMLGPKHQPARVFALPGVPAEMMQMWDATVEPSLKSYLGNTPTIRRAVVKCFGLGESDMEARLGGMIARKYSPLVGITVSRATIALRIDVTAASDAEAQTQIDEVRQDIYRRVGEYVFGEGDNYELPDAVNDRLNETNQTLCLIEFGRNAVLADWLASSVDASRFRGALQADDSRAAARMIGLSEVEAHNLSVTQIADKFRANCDADWCLVVDRYPLANAVDGKPLPAADVTFTAVGKRLTKPLQSTERLGGHPDIIASRTAKAALFFWLRQTSGK